MKVNKYSQLQVLTSKRVPHSGLTLGKISDIQINKTQTNKQKVGLGTDKPGFASSETAEQKRTEGWELARCYLYYTICHLS